MLAKRIIPCLDIKDGRVVKGVNFVELRDAGDPVEHAAVSPDTYRSFGFPGADDLGNMFEHHTLFEDEVRGMRSVETARALNPQLQSFSEWLKENGSRIPVQ